MNDEQYKRFRKMDSDPIKCLFIKKDKVGNIHFLINGSKESHYKVTIGKNGTLTCSCPDFINNCKQNRCVCKHCLHVIYKKLKLFKNLEHSFFNRLYFTPDEIQNINNIFKNNLNKKI